MLDDSSIKRLLKFLLGICNFLEGNRQEEELIGSPMVLKTCLVSCVNTSLLLNGRVSSDYNNISVCFAVLGSGGNSCEIELGLFTFHFDVCHVN